MVSFYRITNAEDKWYKAFIAVYSVSFPVHEQRNEMQQLLAFDDKRYHLLITVKGDKLLSFVAYWDFDTYVYIEHLAVNPDCRGENIGSSMLNAFAKKVNKTVLLEIDPIENEIAEKRFRFYEKLGYKKNPYNHTHPPYNPVFKPHELIVLSLGKELGEDQYKLFYRDLVNIVMNVNS